MRLLLLLFVGSKENIIAPYSHANSHETRTGIRFRSSNQGISVRQYFLQYQTVEFEAKDLFRLRVCS